MILQENVKKTKKYWIFYVKYERMYAVIYDIFLSKDKRVSKYNQI